VVLHSQMLTARKVLVRVLMYTAQVGLCFPRIQQRNHGVTAISSASRMRLAAYHCSTRIQHLVLSLPCRQYGHSPSRLVDTSSGFVRHLALFIGDTPPPLIISSKKRIALIATVITGNRLVSAEASCVNGVTSPT
jgi:hypothetical protein